MTPKSDSELLREIHKDVGVIKNELFNHVNIRLDDHGKRIKWLERIAWSLIAGIFMLGLAIKYVSVTHAAAETLQEKQHQQIMQEVQKEERGEAKTH